MNKLSHIFNWYISFSLNNGRIGNYAIKLDVTNKFTLSSFLSWPEILIFNFLRRPIANITRKVAKTPLPRTHCCNLVSQSTILSMIFRLICASYISQAHFFFSFFSPSPPNAKLEPFSHRNR